MPLIHFGQRPVRMGRTIEDYLKCRRRPRDEMYTGYVRFHITFYKIQEPGSSRVIGEEPHFPLWKRGYLHSSDNYLCEYAYAVRVYSVPDMCRGLTKIGLIYPRLGTAFSGF
jgi:hypothetical protein